MLYCAQVHFEYIDILNDQSMKSSCNMPLEWSPFGCCSYLSSLDVNDVNCAQHAAHILSRVVAYRWIHCACILAAFMWDKCERR